MALISNRFLSSTFLMAILFAMILCSGQLSINSYGFTSSVNNSVKDPSAKPDQISFDFFPSDNEKKPGTIDDMSSPMLNSLFQGLDNREVCGDKKDNNKNGIVDENCSALPSSQPDSLGQLPPQNSIGELPDLPQNDNQNPEPEICGDGKDNNGNGQVDENCNSQPPEPPQNDNQNPEPEICGDGDDNNGNGQVDENCNNQSSGSDDTQNPEPEICGDGDDNNGNGQVDENCNNQSPGGDDKKNPPAEDDQNPPAEDDQNPPAEDDQNPPAEQEICGDGEDNDGNGQVDENCNNQPPASDDTQNPESEICGDGEDNDGNGQVDENCNNQPPGGDDNQNPPAEDDQNPPAEDDQNPPAEQEICGDGEDNDGNGEVDEECETGN